MKIHKPTHEDRAFASQLHEFAYSHFPMAKDQDEAQIDAMSKLIAEFRAGVELTGYRRRQLDENCVSIDQCGCSPTANTSS